MIRTSRYLPFLYTFDRDSDRTGQTKGASLIYNVKWSHNYLKIWLAYKLFAYSLFFPYSLTGLRLKKSLRFPCDGCKRALVSVSFCSFYLKGSLKSTSFRNIWSLREQRLWYLFNYILVKGFLLPLSLALRFTRLITTFWVFLWGLRIVTRDNRFFRLTSCSGTTRSFP